MITIPNYQILNQIYESTNSLVYRGLRNEDNQPVILKVLKEDYPTSEELTRYQQEYDLIRHFHLDGVIKVYSLEKHHNQLVICLEDFGGQSLKHWLSEHTFSLEELLRLAIHAADILGQIHQHNIIHKDINPTNWVWNPTTGQLKLIDFGISTQLSRENMTLKNPQGLEGTLAYMSPEQTGRMNQAIDYRTDLYSLGVTFYELLTGMLPFNVTDSLELVHSHLAKTPILVCDANTDIPPIISNIVMKLMAKNREARYQSAFGLKWDLEKCLANIKNLGDIHFELGQNDFSGQFQIPQKLYGRDHEIKTLLQAFERVSLGTAELMLVAGYSGVGKSALVYEVHKPMTSRRGYFAAGKFDQYQRNIPYSAIAQAFNEWCHYLLVEPATQLHQWQQKILAAIGQNGQVLIDVIPSLELIIGKQPPVAQVGPQEAQNRFNLVFQSFMRTICQQTHPLVLFIDDLQWADLPSLTLLKTLLADTDNQYFLIIGAYRDNEVDATHPLMMMVKESTEAQATVNTIHLTTLSATDVNTLITEALGCEPSYTKTLTDLVYGKTQGNAFFLREFLKSLYTQELLSFDWQQRQWQWEVESIAAKGMTDNVVALMANKIGLLPQETQNVLKLAACIGNQFDLQTLSLIYQQPQKNTLAFLWTAIEEDLLLPLDDHYKQLKFTETAPEEVVTRFKFQHDRVQQAAYSLIVEGQEQVVHLQIGRLLLAHTERQEDNIFDIVNQFNKALALIDEGSEKIKLAELNLRAGQKAKLASAYQSAFDYLHTGIELLDDSAWKNHYLLSLQLYTEAAEVAYLNANFELMDRRIQVVLQQAQTILDRVKVYEVQMNALVAKNNMGAALNTILDLLKQLGVNFPEQPNNSDVQLGLAEVKSNLHGKPIETLYDLPKMTAPDKLIIMRLLATVGTAAYVAMPDMFPLMVFKMINLSLKHGNAPESVYGYISYSVILRGIGTDIEVSFQLRPLSLRLLEKLKADAYKTKVLLNAEGFIRPWKEHIRETFQPLLLGYQSRLETGDVVFASYCVNIYLFYLFLSGNQELAVLKQEIVDYTQSLVQLKQETVASWNKICWQTILNLRGQEDFTGSPPDILMGDVYSEANMLPIHQQGHDNVGIFHLYLVKVILSYLFQAYPQAVENVILADKYSIGLDKLGGWLIFPIFRFYESLVWLAVYPDSSPSEQKEILDKVTLHQNNRKEWSKHAPMNFLHKFYLVEAERCRVLGKDGEAREYYDKAIELAQEHEYVNEEALASELAGRFYLAKGKPKVAQVYLRDAHYAYQRWGALAKVRDLEEKYPQLVVSETPTIPVQSRAMATRAITAMGSSTRMASSTFLDLNSVIKASQTVSGEIVLSRLLEKMMHIVIENAGAEKGFLLLPVKDNWFIEAEGYVDSEAVNVLQSIPIEDQKPLATTIIHYVVRTQKNVVLNDATEEGQFSRDPYIVKQRPKSVLCAPLVNQGQLAGILYLENNLTTGAFTQERLEVLKVLSSQIAISIENALLYRTLEQRVEERTAQLAQANSQLAEANQEITQLNERLEEENLRMSAELKVSKQLQQMLLPTTEELKQINELEIVGFMEPADEVGGDYYDVFRHNGRIILGIGDVAGHGLESGAVAMMVQSIVRALTIHNETDPVKFLDTLNRAIYDNVQRMNSDKNLTFSLLSYQDGLIHLTGQHEEMIVVREGHLERVDTLDLGFPIGLEQDIANLVAQTSVSINPGDVVVLYTDGITEAENIAGEFYEQERLCEAIQQNWQRSAEEIKQAVIDDVMQFIGTQTVFDDITLLVLKQK